MTEFQVGDKVCDTVTGKTYEVLAIDSEGKELQLKAQDESGKVGWHFDIGFEKRSLEPVGIEQAKQTLIDNTLQERGKRYGSFNDLARISQDLKEVMRAADGWNRLTASQKEALEMVQHKVARMLNGDPTYQDNAVDIVGYATLMMKNMQGDLSI